MFDRLDTDHSNYIESDEIASMMKHFTHDEASDEDCRRTVLELLDSFDENNDGKINKEEFDKVLRNLMEGLCG